MKFTKLEITYLVISTTAMIILFIAFCVSLILSDIKHDEHIKQLYENDLILQERLEQLEQYEYYEETEERIGEI